VSAKDRQFIEQMRKPREISQRFQSRTRRTRDKNRAKCRPYVIFPGSKNPGSKNNRRAANYYYYHYYQRAPQLYRGFRGKPLRYNLDLRRRALSHLSK